MHDKNKTMSNSITKFSTILNVCSIINSRNDLNFILYTYLTYSLCCTYLHNIV